MKMIWSTVATVALLLSGTSYGHPLSNPDVGYSKRQSLFADSDLSPSERDTIIVNKNRWLSLPATPVLPEGFYPDGKYANVNGIKLWYNKFGPPKSKKPPVVFLHGGLANSNYFGLQVEALRSEYQIITIDSRGHGRSTTDFNKPLGYDLMTEDVAALMKQLGVKKASFVGWSDGGIISLNLAKKHPKLIHKAYAFAANYNTSGVMDTTLSNVFMTYVNRTSFEYAKLSPTPAKYNDFLEQISNMWAGQPDWDRSFFTTIKNPKNIWIVDGDHEEAVHRNQQLDMADWLGEAGLLILPQVSHFAFIQDHELFTTTVKQLLEQK